MKTSSKLRRLQRIRKLRRQRRTFFFVVVFLISMMAHSAFSKTNTEDTVHVESVKVQAGDSLWSIAAEYKPEGKDLREFVYEIANDNGIEDCKIYCGQIINVPNLKQDVQIKVVFKENHLFFC